VRQTKVKSFRLPLGYGLLIGAVLGASPVRAEAPRIQGVMIFAATADGNWDLFAWHGMPRNELVRLTETRYDEKSPAVSGDGRMLAYATSAGELAIRELEAGEAKILELDGFPGHWDFPAFSPDSKALVCTYFEGDVQDRARLAIVDLETQQVRFPLDQYGPQVAPAWEPEGGRVVYGYGHCNDACGRIIQEPWLFNVSTGKAQQAVMTGSNAVDFAWDPAGKTLAFSSDQAGNFDIWTFRPEAAEQHRVTDYPGFDGSPTFGPEGRKLAFVSNRSGKSKIWILDLETKSVVLFDPLGAERGAAYKDVEWK